MGRHLSEQNRHLNNKKEQAVRTGKETSSAGLSYMERRMAGRTGREAAVAAIVPAMIAAVLLAAFMFVPLDGWMRCVAFLIPFVIAGFDVFMESVERIAARNYFDKAPVTLIAAIAAEVSFSMATQARIGAIFFHSPPSYRFFLKKAPPFLPKRVGK